MFSKRDEQELAPFELFFLQLLCRVFGRVVLGRLCGGNADNKI